MNSNNISDPKSRKIVQRKYKSPMVSLIMIQKSKNSTQHIKPVIGQENCSQSTPGHFGALCTKNVPFRTQGWIAHLMIKYVISKQLKYSIWYHFYTHPFMYNILFSYILSAFQQIKFAAIHLRYTSSIFSLNTQLLMFKSLLNLLLIFEVIKLHNMQLYIFLYLLPL